MIKIKNQLKILMAEDDPDDRLLVKDAIESVANIESLDFVEDGEQLLDYLLQRKKFVGHASHPYLIILDLNLPKKDGRQALKEIKSHPQLRKIPVVVLTTSKNINDIALTYDLGINSYIIKPMSFEQLISIMKTLIEYWSEVVELPPHE